MTSAADLYIEELESQRDMRQIRLREPDKQCYDSTDAGDIHYVLDAKLDQIIAGQKQIFDIMKHIKDLITVTEL